MDVRGTYCKREKSRMGSSGIKSLLNSYFTTMCIMYNRDRQCQWKYRGLFFCKSHNTRHELAYFFQGPTVAIGHLKID